MSASTASSPAIDALALTSAQYGAAAQDLPLPRGHTGGEAGAIERYSRFFRAGDTNLPHIGSGPRPITRIHESDSPEGLVRKFCQRLDNAPTTTPAPTSLIQLGTPATQTPQALETESVLIPMVGKKRILSHTLCVSSQVGCAMGCTFCQTAQMGKLRDLSPAEIVGQWFAARHLLDAGGCDTIRNIVFMGMGEPTDNLESVIQAIAVLTDHRGVNLPMSRITVSTVGNVRGIRRLAAQVHTPGWHRLNLAVSLNAPTDDIRSSIMPVNRAHPLMELREAILDWPIYGGAKICFEYVLIPGVNDAREHATLLADFVLGRGRYEGQRSRSEHELAAADPRGRLHGMINLIPYNPRDNSPWRAPTEEEADAFLAWLIDEGVFAKRRRTKGRDTMAACGQLGNPALRRQRRTATPAPQPA